MFAMLQTRKTKRLKTIAPSTRNPSPPFICYRRCEAEGQPITPEYVVDDKGMGRPPKAGPKCCPDRGSQTKFVAGKEKILHQELKFHGAKVHLREMTASDRSVDELRN